MCFIAVRLGASAGRCRAAGEGEPGCLVRVDMEAGAPECLDSGYWRYVSARADAQSVFFIRDTQIVRMSR